MPNPNRRFVAEVFEGYVRAAYPRTAISESQKRELRRAFFAGAHLIVNEMIRIGGG